AVAGRGLPIDVARVIAGDVLAESGERASFAAATKGANSDVAQPMLQRHQPETTDVGQRRHHDALSTEWHADDPRQQPEPARQPERDIAESKCAPPHRSKP